MNGRQAIIDYKNYTHFLIFFKFYFYLLALVLTLTFPVHGERESVLDTWREKTETQRRLEMPTK